MTAEVVVLNKSAVALAADSTVTIGGNRKTYNTVNKVFTLSKHHPVGVMIYGNAELMGMPWETTIKEFRRHLGESNFETLEEYATELVGFVEGSRMLFPENSQRDFFRGWVQIYFRDVRKQITADVNEATKAGPKVTENQISEIASARIMKVWETLEATPALPTFCEGFTESLAEQYKGEIDGAIDEVFSRFGLAENAIACLKRIAAGLFVRPVLGGISGIVVAGFGESEPFPSVCAIACQSIVLNKLTHQIDANRSKKISFQNEGMVIPFAQSDVVRSFVEGVDPDFRRIVDSYLGKFLEEFPERIADQMAEETREITRQRLAEMSKQALNEFRQRIERHVTEKHIHPLLDVIGFLPKDELAAMAEALVSLTSVKRKMSLELETVGGPVDLAVISKGDGFVWIKRKHYFDPKLNPHFFPKYFDR